MQGGLGDDIYDVLKNDDDINPDSLGIFDFTEDPQSPGNSHQEIYSQSSSPNAFKSPFIEEGANQV